MEDKGFSIPKFDTEAILADILKQASAYPDDTSETVVPSVKPVDPPDTMAVNPPEVDDQLDISDDTSEEMRQLLLEMRGTTRELQAEVKQLREQLAQRNYENSKGSVEKPQTDKVSDTSDQSNIQGEPSAKKKNRAITIISNVLFYIMIVAIVLGAFLVRSSISGRPVMFAGYSAFTVLTSSMEDVYPKGSLVVTKTVDPKELQIGDDITFMVNENTSVTHRIVAIDENFQGTGKRAFTTKGTMNKDNDTNPVAAVNVVGKVVYSSKMLGDVAGFVRNNWPYLLFVMIVTITLHAVLKRTFKDEDDKEHQKR